MRILWSINNLVPDIAEKIGIQSGHAISWIDAMGKRLAPMTEISLAMATVWNVDSLKKYEFDNVVYYLFPRKNTEHDYWADIISDFKPDVIHAYGTELPHNIKLLENHNDKPIVVSLQGILTEYARHYYGGIDLLTMIKYTRLKDFFLPTGFFSGKKNFVKRSKGEQKILSLAQNVEGRSSWDKVAALKINPTLNYYYLPRMIRDPFYSGAKWNVNSIERHTILIHQGNTPIKGLHFLLEAVSMLKGKFPDIKLYVAGGNFLESKGWKSRIKQHEYIKYLKDIIKKNELTPYIHFLGFLNAEKMAEQLSHVHVAVLPSAIENAPNSIAEAQLVGTPCVATFVGGNMDMVDHGHNGFLYCYNEPNMLAFYINKLFESDELALNFSTKSRLTALERHDPDKLVKDILVIYRKIAKLKFEA